MACPLILKRLYAKRPDSVRPSARPHPSFYKHEELLVWRETGMLVYATTEARTGRIFPSTLLDPLNNSSVYPTDLIQAPYHCYSTCFETSPFHNTDHTALELQ